MRKLMIAPVLAAVMLGGCGAPAGNDAASENAAVAAEPANADAEANAVGNVAESDNALARVLALNDAQRNGVFYRALEDAGVACQKVTSSERMPDMDGKPLWRADCDSKIASASTSHMITITPDGTAQIVSRSDR